MVHAAEKKFNYGLITAVQKGSPAAKAGLRPGDKLLTLNGKRLLDILDYHFLTDASLLKFTVLRQAKIKEFTVKNSYQEPLGLKFASSVFNTVKRCRNNCLFCFVDQLPPGLRSSLYLKDDDYRLSFLYGNFITLTNLTAKEVNRIVKLRLSPLYISWQATTRKVREKLMRIAGEDKAVEYLKVLDEAGLITHIQIVLCPGFNDGKELEKSLNFLAGFKNIGSVGIVPVGLSYHRKSLTKLKPVTPQLAKELIAWVSQKQAEFKKRTGTNWVYLADEFYLLAGEKLPPDKAYDGYPQLENGIGIARNFLTEIKKGLKKLKERKVRLAEPVTVITGTLSAGILKKAFQEIAKVTGIKFAVQAVTNRWLGKSITVTGLLSGADIANTVKEIKSGTIFIPSVCLNAVSLTDKQQKSAHSSQLEGFASQLFLDGLSVADIKRSTTAQIVVVPANGSDLIRFLVANFSPSSWQSLKQEKRYA